MKYMPAGEFKARCLRVMEEVRTRREPVVITKKGVAVAKLVPTDDDTPDIFGCMRGTGEITGDILSPVVSKHAWSSAR